MHSQDLRDEVQLLRKQIGEHAVAPPPIPRAPSASILAFQSPAHQPSHLHQQVPPALPQASPSSHYDSGNSAGSVAGVGGVGMSHDEAQQLTFFQQELAANFAVRLAFDLLPVSVSLVVPVSSSSCP
jgi:hypothetical protein